MKHEETGDTLDADWTESPFSEGEYAQDENPMLGEMPNHPLHVKVVDTQEQQVAPEFTAWNTQQVPLVGNQPVTLCPHKYHRKIARFRVNWGNQTVTQSGAIAAAVAGFVFIGAGSPVGQVGASQYLTGFSVELAGADANPVTFTVTGTATPAAYILPAGQTQMTVTFPTPLLTNTTTPRVSWTATATQTGEIDLYGMNEPILYLSNKQDPLTSNALQNVWQLQSTLSGGSSFSGSMPDYDGQQTLYAVASQAGVSIAVMDETYGTVQ